jgi:hypothetical protein
MSFLAPLMLLGLVGAAIPVAIHLIGRRRARIVGFAAIDFLLGSNKRIARRLRLRERLLLALRIMVCLAIPLILAKPFAACQSTAPQVEAGPQATVFVIDNSLISSHSHDGKSVLDQAKAASRDMLRQLGPEAEVAILGAAEGAATPKELSRDHRSLRAAVDALEAEPRPADIHGALGRAARLLDSSTQPRKHVILLSPLAATGFQGEPPWPPESAPRLTVVDPARGLELSNAAVTALAVAVDADAGLRGLRVVAEVANFGSQPVERSVRVRVGERVVSRGSVALRPGEQTQKQFSTALPEGARMADLVVELDSDAIAADDRRFVRVQLRDQVRTLLVNGDPRTVRHDDELFYLETALRPGDRGDSGVTLATTTADELPTLDLELYDVVVLANVRALASRTVTRLSAWVQAGGGLFISMGNNVDADHYNQTMLPLLPQQLRDPLDATYGTRGAERQGRALRLGTLDPTHPLLTVFSAQAAELREAHFHRVMLLGPTTRVDQRTVLARYSNDAAALIASSSGSGRLLLFTSTVDRDWNDLSIHPGYLPLMQRAVRYLARKHDDQQRSEVYVGHSHSIAVPSGTTRVRVVGPKGRTLIEGERVNNRREVAFRQTFAPGTYRVALAGNAGAPVDRPEAHFVVNIDPRASDIRPWNTAPTSKPEAPQVLSAAAEPAHRRRVELWHGVAAGLLLLLLGESLLTLRD